MEGEVRCDKCSSAKDVQEHHIIPRSIGNPKSLKNGKRVWLCKKHHDIIEGILIKLIWTWVEKKEECKDEIRAFTEAWVKKN